MKGFPNQVAELPKLITAMSVLTSLVDGRRDAKNDGVFGEELVRTGVAGTGHTPMPVENYLALQRLKDTSSQSFRTTARGLRELFRLFNFIDDSQERILATPLGRRAASFAGRELDAEQINFWRGVVSNMPHTGRDGATSHPYQVLLRLVGRVPQITRAKCALALEAVDDSQRELDRIVRLAALDEEEIRRRIGVTKSNWDNAKKVLPRIAEQLEDIIRTGETYVLADSPGRAGAGPAIEGGGTIGRRTNQPRAPRSSRSVTPETIAIAGIADKVEGPELPPDLDPVRAEQARRIRLQRLARHNTIVRRLATQISRQAERIYENPFDVLAILRHVGILAEVKTLDGTPEDERERVQECLAQLLYYEAFVTPPDAREVTIHKVACFEGQISTEHAQWLNRSNIGVIWAVGGGFGADRLAQSMIGPYLQ